MNSPTTFKRFAYSLTAAAVAIGLVSCATPIPDQLLPGFTPAEVDHVAVLPVLDNRIERAKARDYQKWVIREEVEPSLKHKGYSFTIYTDPSLVASVTRPQLANPSPEWIARLEPKHERWILLVAVNDSTAKLTFGSTGNAELQGFLFDKVRKSVVWREQAIGREGQGGLIGMTMIGVVERSAVEKAAKNVMASLPKRK
jgi:hypothetical protein